jgi:hypothetical protein
MTKTTGPSLPAAARASARCAHVGGFQAPGNSTSVGFGGTARLIRTWRDSAWDFISGLLVMLTAIPFWKMYAFLRETGRLMGG